VFVDFSQVAQQRVYFFSSILKLLDH
jgi:hypothetical protein